jgi:hypothetical protein
MRKLVANVNFCKFTNSLCIVWGGEKMKFENTGLENLKVDLVRLDEIMKESGLIRESQWDYDRVTYDRKFEMKEGVFYLRVQGYAVEGDVGANKATIQLITPILGKYYFPHGVEYEGEDFPNSLVSQCKEILADLQKKIVTIAK